VEARQERRAAARGSREVATARRLRRSGRKEIWRSGALPWRVQIWPAQRPPAEAA
jgi:hypothetical protein